MFVIARRSALAFHARDASTVSPLSRLWISRGWKRPLEPAILAQVYWRKFGVTGRSVAFAGEIATFVALRSGASKECSAHSSGEACDGGKNTRRVVRVARVAADRPSGSRSSIIRDRVLTILDT